MNKTLLDWGTWGHTSNLISYVLDFLVNKNILTEYYFQWKYWKSLLMCSFECMLIFYKWELNWSHFRVYLQLSTYSFQVLIFIFMLNMENFSRKLRTWITQFAKSKFSCKGLILVIILVSASTNIEQESWAGNQLLFHWEKLNKC